MLQLNLGNYDQMMPATKPRPLPSQLRPKLPSGARTPIAPSAEWASRSCGYGFSLVNGVCMSQGCIDSRSPCVVMDGHGRTCSYDQLLAFQHQSGVPACGPAPQLPPPPNAPVEQPPGFVVDVSPSPGTQAVAVLPNDQLVPRFRAPTWALAISGVAVAVIVIALLARR